MIYELNLATQPFRNRALPSLVAVLLTCLALIAFAYIITNGRATNARAETIEQDLRELRSERDKLNEKAREVRGQLTPEERRSLDAAHLLVDRKRFAWSRLFADLERALPSGVRVARIGVRDVARSAGQTQADLDLTVVARAPDEVTEMINDMERTGTFSVEPVSENPRASKGESGVEWALRVHYTPRESFNLERDDTATPNDANAR